ncbi:MAG TPA: PAS domain S-box protein, partial [Methanomethylovorans sp.]|nr:PAS domain S-box protein [Methanomethylovorans sp.]
MIYLNSEFRILYVNKAAEDLFGWTLDELRGKSIDILKVDSLSEQVKDKIKDILNNGGSYSIDSLSEKKEGTTFFCELDFYPFYDDNGNLCGFLTSQRDITQRKL